jgi:hypothetical protein
MHRHIISFTTHDASLNKIPFSIKTLCPTICGGIHGATIGFRTIINIQGWRATASQGELG